jgi:hypothetical protein
MEQNTKVKRPARRSPGQRKTISLSSNSDSVKQRTLFSDTELLTVIEPAIPGISLAGWVNQNQGQVSELIHRHGGILFRGFGVNGDKDFQQVIKIIPFEAVDASNFEESTPREQVMEGVYTTTSFPSEETISLHSDYTPSMILANKICFFCALPAMEKGETPFADNRSILKRIDKDVSDKFRRLGWTLVRNYGHGLGLSWQDTFFGKDKMAVERHCAEKKVQAQWRGKFLRTKQVRSAIYQHPITGEDCWFNHISFWHIANLSDNVRHTMLEQVGYEGMPFNTYYGDGSKIPDDIAHHLRDVLLAEKKTFTWQQGDVLLADNILTSHGREPFSGARTIRVALFDKFTRPTFNLNHAGG